MACARIAGSRFRGFGARRGGMGMGGFGGLPSNSLLLEPRSGGVLARVEPGHQKILQRKCHYERRNSHSNIRPGPLQPKPSDQDPGHNRHGGTLPKLDESL